MGAQHRGMGTTTNTPDSGKVLILMAARLAAYAAAALTASLLTACSGSATQSAAPTAASSVSPVATTSAVAVEPHDSSDVMFAMHMIPHHEQAVEMSDILLAKQGVDARVVDLATRIKVAQAPEIEQMRGWLAQWGAPTGMPGHDMGDMGDMMPGMGGAGAMAGMLSESDLTALRNAPGAEAAKLYVSGMIGHHQGAITMAQNEIDNGKSPAAVALARSIIDTQQREIDEMTAILPSL